MARNRGPVRLGSGARFTAGKVWRSRQGGDLPRWNAHRATAQGLGLPVDPDFIAARVAAANCVWTGAQAGGIGSRHAWRAVSQRLALADPRAGNYSHDEYEELKRNYFEYTHYEYRCSACGLDTRETKVAGPLHHTWPVAVRSGFGYDPGRRLLIASDEPGLLIFIVTRPVIPWWWPDPLRINGSYLRRHGLIDGRERLGGGRFAPYCRFLVLVER